jgi:hypothetical protein
VPTRERIAASPRRVAEPVDQPGRGARTRARTVRRARVPPRSPKPSAIMPIPSVNTDSARRLSAVRWACVNSVHMTEFGGVLELVTLLEQRVDVHSGLRAADECGLPPTPSSPRPRRLQPDLLKARQDPVPAAGVVDDQATRTCTPP